jgi:rod shape-determining protein MreC
MAPPSPRRPGFSKRAQMSLFAGYVMAVAGLLLGLLLIITARLDPKGYSAIQTALADLFAPISRTGQAVVMTMRGGGESVSAYWDAAAKNKAMTKELAAARVKIIKGQADALEVARLKRTLAMAERIDAPVVTAPLVSSTAASTRRYAIIAAGASNDVAVGQTVVSAEGLVGRITAVGRASSRVLMIIDADNRVPVKRVRDGVPALAIGTGDGRLELQTLAAGANPFKVGDVFVTSGIGGVYRPGIPVAIATRQSRDKTLALPLAHPSKLDYGIVERPYMIEPPLPVTQSPKEGE